jgi:hypothetical protein
MGTQVGLNALPLNLHLQFRGFLHLGDMPAPTLHIVHMHTTIAGAADIVKIYSGPFWFLPAGRENIILLYSRQGNRTD